jgi:hypothetical protein
MRKRTNVIPVIVFWILLLGTIAFAARPPPTPTCKGEREASNNAVGKAPEGSQSVLVSPRLRDHDCGLHRVDRLEFGI